MAKSSIEATAGETLPAVRVDESYPVLAMEQGRLAKVIKANLGNSRITEFQVDRLKVPTGGGNLWTVPGLEGETNEKEIDGITIFWKEPRAYWEQSFDSSGGGTPPDCSAADGTVGVGKPGGQCGVCPLAQFGTHHKGRGQACKQMRVLFMVRPQDFLPIAVSCPPTSLDNMQKFFLRLASRGIQFNHIITRLSLGQDKNKDGIKYSAIVPSMVRMLNDFEIEAIERYCEAIEPALSRVRVDPTATDFAG